MVTIAKQTARKKDEKATIGIGTLIVFIAMVLVAAIAAAVIIKTAISLKNQAEDTGMAARDEVSDFLKVQDIIGVKNPTQDVLEYVEVTCGAFHGSHGIDMTTMVVHVTTATTVNKHVTMEIPPTNPPVGMTNTNPTFSVDVITGGPTWGTGGAYYLDENMLIKITIYFDGTGATGTGVSPNTELTLTFIPGNGPSMPEQCWTPVAYTGTYIPLY